jgi:hypothetical protein
MKKTIASALLLLIAWFSWPLWTALTIREAVLTGDTAVLESKVDWPGVAHKPEAILVSQARASLGRR